MPSLLGILETVLYVDSFERACTFYEQVLGLNSVYRDQRLCSYDVGGRGLLLLFLPLLFSLRVFLRPHASVRSFRLLLLLLLLRRCSSLSLAVPSLVQIPSSSSTASPGVTIRLGHQIPST